ncbi:hypothetical protein [Thermococcus sp.]|uniref:hypothetical protein n=1 Tax=Thermococcus sp. TaxID=35749 RepID=UPI00261EDF41|nr:hypothetical protein [Thermococcus sp.]
MNSTGTYYRLSKSAVPVNVTLCEKKGASKTPARLEENKNGGEKKTRGICGPGFVALLAVLASLMKGRSSDD